MFSTISWHEYLIVISGICFIYYLSILLWIYKKDFLNFLGIRKYQDEALVSDIDSHHSVLGQAKLFSTTSVSSEELQFVNEESQSINHLSNPAAHED
jgi:hypothetical protein